MAKQRDGDWISWAGPLGTTWGYRHRRRFEDVSKLEGFIAQAHGMTFTSAVDISPWGGVTRRIEGHSVHAFEDLMKVAEGSHVLGLTVTGIDDSPQATAKWRVTFHHSVMDDSTRLFDVECGDGGIMLRGAIEEATVPVRKSRPVVVLPPLTGNEAELERRRTRATLVGAAAGAAAGLVASLAVLGLEAVLS